MTPILVGPLPFTANPGRSSAGAGLANLATPNPKEPFVAAAIGPATIAVDLGAPAVVDAVFLGYTNLPEGAPVDVYADEVAIGTAYACHSYRRAPARHVFLVLDAPVAASALRLEVAGADAALVAGVVATGLAIRASAGVDQDWGRPITDPTAVTRLPGGGFGIDRSVAAGGYQWTMSGLTDEERDRLYALQLDYGIGSTVLAIEDAAALLGRNEAAHWGLVVKPDVFARQAPGESKWSWQLQDWA